MKDLCGELCTSGGMTFMQILNKQNENVDWNHLAPDKVQWQTCLKTLLNPQVPLKGGANLSNIQ